MRFFYETKHSFYLIFLIAHFSANDNEIFLPETSRFKNSVKLSIAKNSTLTIKRES